MNERQYLKFIEEMRAAGQCRTSPKSAQRYAAQLRADSVLTRMLVAEGICAEGQTALDITDSEVLQKLNRWQAVQNLEDRSRAAVKLLLKIHGIEPMTKRAAERQNMEAAETPEHVTSVRGPKTLKQMSLKEPFSQNRLSEPPLSLYGLLSALRQSTKNRRDKDAEPAYALLMCPLLQRFDFKWNIDSTEPDLRIWGSRYAENAALIRANLLDEEIRVMVVEDLEYALRTLENDAEDSTLRDDVARACEHIETAMEDWFMSNLRQADGYPGSQARRLLRQMACMQEGAGSLLYSKITDAEVADKLAELFLLALEAAEGIYQPAESWEEELKTLTPQQHDMLAAAGCGLPVRRNVLNQSGRRGLLLELVEKGLLTPRKDRLLPACGMKPLSLVCLAAEDGSMKKERAVDLLLQLLKKTSPWDAETEIREALFDHLEELADVLLPCEERSEILSWMVDWHWGHVQSHLPKRSIHSTEQLLSWMKKYPDEMQCILRKEMSADPWDAELRLKVRGGVSLMECELQSLLSQRCLELALNEEESEGGYWAVCAANEARKALLLLECVEEPYMLMESWQTLALGLALQARMEAGQPESRRPYTARTLVKEYVLPALKAIEEARRYHAQLSDEAAERTRETLEQMMQACRQQLFGGDSPVKKCIQACVNEFDADRWSDAGWVESQGLNCLEDYDLFQIMHRQNRPAKLFLPWYCNTFDSTLACGPVCTQERTEASLLNILLSGQKVTMSTNQMVDNEKIWNLTDVPAFLWLLRRGYVSVSLFGGLTCLMDYAVSRMRNPNFYWSSLPDDFADVKLREAAADFLAGNISASQLPQKHRRILVKMRDAILLMDENLPSGWRRYYDQQNDIYIKKRGIAPFVSLSKRVMAYYSEEKPLVSFDEMRRLNEVLTSITPGLDRSVYRQLVWAIRDVDYGRMEELGLSPALLEQAGLAADYLAEKKQEMLQDMIRIVDDCQNRMLGERISNYQYYVYDDAAARIRPEWSAGPVNDSGQLLYRQMEKEVDREGALLGWSQVPERIMALERLADEYPKADAEQLCSRLANQGLREYGAFGLKGSMRLKELAFKASSGAAVVREYTEEKNQGELYQMERDLSQEDGKQGE